MNDPRQEQGAHDEGVDEHPDGDDEGQLDEEEQRDDDERAERRGEDEPGGGDDAAGDRQAAADPLPGAVGQGLLPDPGHEEDRVVDAQRDEEDETVEGHRGVRAGEVEDVVEHDRRQAQRRGEGQHVDREDDQRRDDRPQQDDEHDEDRGEDERDDGPQVLGGGLLGVEPFGSGAADEGVGVHLVCGGADVTGGDGGLLALRRGGGRGLELDASVDDDGLLGLVGDGPGAVDAVHGEDGLEHVVGVVLAGDDDDGLHLSGVEVGGEHLLAGDRLDLVEEHLRLAGALGLERGQERGEAEEDHRRGQPDRARPAGDEARDPPPQAADLVRVGRLGCVGGPARPEQRAGASAGDEEDGREEGQGGEDGGGDADGTDRPEAGVGAEVGQEEAEQADDDGAGAGEDRLEGGAPGHPHRLRGRLAQDELLAVARHDEEAVVGGGANHEDRQDALALPVEEQGAVRGERLDHEGGGAQREDGGDEDGEGQDRRAVDDDEDDEDDDQRHGEEHAVDAAEGADEVGDVARRTGHPGREVRPDELLVGERAQLVDDDGDHAVLPHELVGQLPRDRHGQQQRLPVLGGDDRDRAVEDVADDLAVRQLALHGRGREGLGRRDVRRGELPAAGGLEDDEGRQRLPLGELGGELTRPRGLRARGEERRLVVLLDLRERPLGHPPEGTGGEPPGEDEGEEEGAQHRAAA